MKDAYPRVDAIDGTRVRLPGRVSRPTDASGFYELSAPAGTVEVEVRAKTGGAGRGTASVRPGETVSLTVVMDPKKRKE